MVIIYVFFVFFFFSDVYVLLYFVPSAYKHGSVHSFLFQAQIRHAVGALAKTVGTPAAADIHLPVLSLHSCLWEFVSK
jgi:hypothetical protein